MSSTGDVRETAASAGTETADASVARSEQSVLAVIPAYNEAATIAEVATQARRYVDEVVVVDDASGDDTADVAREAADGVVSHPENLGVGGAVHTGYRLAVEQGYDRLVQLDGDGQHDPAYIPEMLDRMDETDAGMVVGSRWLNASHAEYNLLRRAGIRFYTMEANLLGDLNVTDVTSGYRVYDVSMLAELERPAHDHWALEQTLEVARKGYDVEEVSVPMPPETEGSQFDVGTYARYPVRMALTTLKVLIFR